MVGVLLGEHRKGRLDVTSSFAGTSPFRIEDAKPLACHEPALSFARHPARVSPFRQICDGAFSPFALTQPPP